MIFNVFGGAEQEFLGPTSGKFGELSVEGVFQSGMFPGLELVD